jgi:excisionase family DNA binding protein
MADDYLTPEQVAERLNVSPRAVLEWLRHGRLVGHKFGRLWRVDVKDLEAFIQASRVEPRQPVLTTPRHDGEDR